MNSREQVTSIFNHFHAQIQNQNMIEVQEFLSYLFTCEVPSNFQYPNDQLIEKLESQKAKYLGLDQFLPIMSVIPDQKQNEAYISWLFNYIKPMDSKELQRADMSKFSQDQSKELIQMFSMFKIPNSQRMDLTEFVNVLSSENKLANNNALLIQKMNASKIKQVDFQTFVKFFELDFHQQENFVNLFYIIDSNKSGVISLPELNDANEKFQLGLTDEEMEIMINYPNCEDPQKIKVNTLYDLIVKHTQVNE